MIYNKLLLLNEFERIKKMGWVKSMRNGSTGVGYTFEKLLNLSENTFPLPDYLGIEIKTHRKKSNSKITLFNYDPAGSYSYELKHLYDSYGYNSSKCAYKKVLTATFYCHIKKKMPCNYKISLQIDHFNKKIFLLVYDLHNNLVEKDAYWEFYTLRKKLYDKIQFLAYVVADNKLVNGVEFFHYSSIKFYKIRDFDTFINLLDHCKISISFKIGGNVVLDYPWQIDNHGTSFSIKVTDLPLLFENF